ncbi:hypothetical protein GGQ57_000161 [Parabacteroides faecis]|uniref:Uncharacterized protein n=1 Tax=Parabacteroides faecis TaxID=1217282 RepID=A0ABR6KFK7_9BACT|nr:hypothetical protein [Parabacteroides faecis]
MIQIKRESGVNPGQSRCCEAPFNILKTTNATDDSVDSGKLTVDSFSVRIYLSTVTCQLSTFRREGFRMGVSQKTCHSLKAHVLVG